jgi:hypothetical protein
MDRTDDKYMDIPLGGSDRTESSNSLELEEMAMVEIEGSTVGGMKVTVDTIDVTESGATLFSIKVSKIQSFVILGWN